MQVKVKAESLFYALANTVANVKAQKLRDTLSDVKAKAQVDALADALVHALADWPKEVKPETQIERLAKGKPQAPLNSTKAGRDSNRKTD